MSETCEIDSRFELSTGLLAGRRVWPHVPEEGEPSFRPLRVLVIDPSAKKLEGRETVAYVPYEKLPLVSSVDCESSNREVSYAEEANWRDVSCLRLDGALFKIYSREVVDLDLNEHRLAMQSGYAVNRSECRFRIQMVYAVCSMTYRAFQMALGRDPEWAVRKATDGSGATISREPWCLDVIIDLFDDRANAYYDEAEVALKLGSFESKNPHSGVDDQKIYSALSNDIVTHEVTHALLDGMRSLLMLPTNPEVSSFHEGFADLVAVFQRFEFPDLIRVCAEQAGWGLLDHPLLTRIGKEFGDGLGSLDGIRNAVEKERQEAALVGIFAPGEWLRYVETEPEEPLVFQEGLECHAMGEVLLRSVYDGFRVAFKRRISRLAAIVGGGRAESSGWMSSELKDELVEETMRTARQFKTMLIRAVDYLPPVDITFSDYLRALITSDMEVLSDDRYDYRGAIIDSFVRRGIKPQGVSGLSPAELKWGKVKTPQEGVLQDGWKVSGLTWQSEWTQQPGTGGDKKGGDYTWEKHERNSRDQGERVVGGIMDFICLGGADGEDSQWGLLGLIDPGRRRRSVDGLRFQRIGKVVVESVRHARRSGSTGRMMVDTIIELSQHVKGEIDGSKMEMKGGVTLVLDDLGRLRYAIRKSVRKPSSWRRMLGYSRGGGAGLWERGRGGYLKPIKDLIAKIHSG